MRNLKNRLRTTESRLDWGSSFPAFLNGAETAILRSDLDSAIAESQNVGLFLCAGNIYSYLDGEIL